MLLFVGGVFWNHGQKVVDFLKTHINPPSPIIIIKIIILVTLYSH